MATTTLRLGPTDHGRRMTLDEFLEAEEEPGFRIELARGVVEVTEVPNDPHALIVCNLIRGIADYDRSHPRAIHRFGGAGEFRLWMPGMASGRNPDVAVVLKGAPLDPRGRRRPVLAAEVVSEGGEDRDYQIKRSEYFAYGLLEYWIVDPIARRVTVLVRDGDRWLERVAQAEQRVDSLVLPGLPLRACDLWAGAEDSEDEVAPDPA